MSHSLRYAQYVCEICIYLFSQIIYVTIVLKFILNYKNIGTTWGIPESKANSPSHTLNSQLNLNLVYSGYVGSKTHVKS